MKSARKPIINTAQWVAGPSIAAGNYGVVQIAAGPNAGQVGYYEADARLGALVALPQKRRGWILDAFAEVENLRLPAPAVARRWLRGIRPEEFEGRRERRWRLRRAENIWAGREKVDRAAYGLVLIADGPWCGRYAYYDDDEGSKAIVYPDHPIHLGFYAGVLFRYLRAVTDAEKERWYKRHDPEYGKTPLFAIDGGKQPEE